MPNNDAASDETQKAIDAEIAKRAQRAKRFGIDASENPAGQEELKKLERAKKFGASVSEIKIDALNRALGDRGDQSNGKGVPTVSKTPAVPAASLSQADLEFEERKRKRAEKFGIPVQPSVTVENKKARV